MAVADGTSQIRLPRQAGPENRPEGERLKTEKRYEKGRVRGAR